MLQHRQSCIDAACPICPLVRQCFPDGHMPLVTDNQGQAQERSNLGSVNSSIQDHQALLDVLQPEQLQQLQQSLGVHHPQELRRYHTGVDTCTLAFPCL